jgi:hypothetical protein
MLSVPNTVRLLSFTAACLAATTLAACSSGGGSKSTPVGAAPSGVQSEAAPAQGPLGVSPGGVTTRMEIPAESTEEQYAQACLTAKDWMDAKGGDPHTLVEPYLKEIQGATDGGRATFGKTWTQLTDPQRAGVIIAVRAAADAGC